MKIRNPSTMIVDLHKKIPRNGASAYGSYFSIFLKDIWVIRPISREFFPFPYIAKMGLL
jgi:hypothetical protein